MHHSLICTDIPIPQMRHKPIYAYSNIDRILFPMITSVSTKCVSTNTSVFEWHLHIATCNYQKMPQHTVSHIATCYHYKNFLTHNVTEKDSMQLNILYIFLGATSYKIQLATRLDHYISVKLQFKYSCKQKMYPRASTRCKLIAFKGVQRFPCLFTPLND